MARLLLVPTILHLQLLQLLLVSAHAVRPLTSPELVAGQHIGWVRHHCLLRSNVDLKCVRPLALK